MGKDKTETTTVALDERSQNYVNHQRGAATDMNRAAIGSDPWAQQTGDLFRQGVNHMGQAGQGMDWMSKTGQGMVEGALGGYGGAMAQGLGGLGNYANNYAQQGIAAMIPGYQFNRSLADQAAGQQATRSGAYGGSREAVLRGEQTGNIDRSFLQGVNLMSQQGTQMGMQAMMQDRMRNAGNVGQGSQMMQNSQQMQQNLANQYGSFDQIQRGADRGLAMDEFTRRQAGLGGLVGGMGPTGSTTTNVKEGNFFQDALGLGLTAAGAVFGGPQGAAMGAQMSGMGSNTPALQGSPIMQNYGGMQGGGLANYGGGFQQYMGMGGLGGFGGQQPGTLFQNPGKFFGG